MPIDNESMRYTHSLWYNEEKIGKRKNIFVYSTGIIGFYNIQTTLPIYGNSDNLARHQYAQIPCVGWPVL
jgi:hypothetical protein